jgi:hypothetical protein
MPQKEESMSKKASTETWLDDPVDDPAATPATETTETAAVPADASTPENTGAADPFDLDALRLDQSFLQTAGAKKLLLTVPVRKPNKQDFNRVHPGPAYRENLAVIELKDDREVYLLTPAVAQNLPNEFFMATVYTAINRQGVLFLFLVRIPGADGKILTWHTSLATAAELAMTQWVRVTANMSLGAYDITPAPAPIPDPEWPEISFKELLRIAFRDRLVTDLDHPLVKRLRGLT